MKRDVKLILMIFMLLFISFNQTAFSHKGFLESDIYWNNEKFLIKSDSIKITLENLSKLFDNREKNSYLIISTINFPELYKPTFNNFGKVVGPDGWFIERLTF